MKKDYQLDAHSEQLMHQYRERLPLYERLSETAYDHVRQVLSQQGIYVTAIEHRVKTEDSLAGKLELKGAKYKSIDDVTDIVGLRIITFYTDDVDKVAVIVKQAFKVDWDNSVDKRKQYNLNSFGYLSLHYVCQLPKAVIDDPEAPLLNTIRFEIQMRTSLQHLWSTVEHDLGYKGGVKMPPEYRRQFNRLAGMMELIDDEFSNLRIRLTDYHRQIQQLVASRKLNEVPLTTDSFRSYLKLHPFDRLNKRIAAVNQAELFPTSLMPYLLVLQTLGLETLGDVQKLIEDYSEDAYVLAISQLATTDLDILAENVGIQNLCCVYVLERGGGQSELLRIIDKLNGKSPANISRANGIIKLAATLPFMKSINSNK